MYKVYAGGHWGSLAVTQMIHYYELWQVPLFNKGLYRVLYSHSTDQFWRLWNMKTIWNRDIRAIMGKPLRMSHPSQPGKRGDNGVCWSWGRGRVPHSYPGSLSSWLARGWTCPLCISGSSPQPSPAATIQQGPTYSQLTTREPITPRHCLPPLRDLRLRQEADSLGGASLHSLQLQLWVHLVTIYYWVQCSLFRQPHERPQPSTLFSKKWNWYRRRNRKMPGFDRHWGTRACLKVW